MYTTGITNVSNDYISPRVLLPEKYVLLHNYFSLPYTARETTYHNPPMGITDHKLLAVGATSLNPSHLNDKLQDSNSVVHTG
jgi:hypothetical protein